MSDSTAAPLEKATLGRQLLRREVNERIRAADLGFRIVEKYGAPSLAAIRAQRRTLRLGACQTS